jgi:peptidyl-prolyl cis-trans isomerase A (cyclophilin A)
MSSKFLPALCSALVLSVGVAAAQPSQAQPKEKKLQPGTYAHFVTTEGDFTVKLFEKEAPKTVANFVGLAEGTIDPATGKPGKSKPFYNGLTFHRVISGFMIQGGDPLGNGTGGPGYKFADEISPNRKFTKAGILAMANAGPNTNGSQFFITLAPTDWLNGKHTIFGEVVEGMDTLKKLEAAGSRGGPTSEPLKIEKVTIEVQ